MSSSNTIHAVHPAYARLRHAAYGERSSLCRALAIEADWRCHDGPEWAARYRQAFGDLTDAVPQPPDTYSAHRPERLAWQALEPGQSDQARQLFRCLLALWHPLVVPGAVRDERASLWSETWQAYRHGDLPALIALWRTARGSSMRTRLPQDVIALRGEHDRLHAARQATDRRLAELSQQFPFMLRDKLEDADWVRRQRLAMQQLRVMTTPPRLRTTAARHKQVC